MKETENRLIRYHDYTVPACMAASTNNPNDIRGYEGLLGSGRSPPPYIAPLQQPLLVRGSVIRLLSLLQVAQATEACPILVLIAPWGFIDKTQGALHVWALIMCTTHTQPQGN